MPEQSLTDRTIARLKLPTNDSVERGLLVDWLVAQLRGETTMADEYVHDQDYLDLERESKAEINRLNAELDAMAQRAASPSEPCWPSTLTVPPVVGPRLARVKRLTPDLAEHITVIQVDEADAEEERFVDELGSAVTVDPQTGGAPVVEGDISKLPLGQQKILAAMSRGAKTQPEMAKAADMQTPLVSMHLGNLVKAGMVVKTKERDMSRKTPGEYALASQVLRDAVEEPIFPKGAMPRNFLALSAAERTGALRMMIEDPDSVGTEYGLSMIDQAHLRTYFARIFKHAPAIQSPVAKDAYWAYVREKEVA